MEWKEYKLGNVCKVINGRAYSLPELLPEGKYPVLRVGNIFEGNKWYYSDLELQEDKYCNEGDLLYAWSCNFGPYIWHGDKTIYHYHIWKLIEDKSIIDKEFLYYYLIFYTETLKSGIHGSVMMHLTKGEIENAVIRIPCVAIQKRIASILKTLDDKIENNRKINENLEQQAQALFKSWFVDFEPFRDQPFVDSELGMIPEGWREGTLGEYCKVRSGFAFKSSWWTESGCKVIKIKNITENGELDLTDCSFVNKENTKRAKDFKAKSGDLIIAMTGATIGKFNIIPKIKEDYYINQRVGKFFLGDTPLKKLPYIYCILKRKDTINIIINKGQGSAQPNISGSDIESIPLVLPPFQVIEDFNTRLIPLFDLIISNRGELQSLTQLRDTLLPKLMSGEIILDNLPQG